jgi:hypothetical protein
VLPFPLTAREDGLCNQALSGREQTRCAAGPRALSGLPVPSCVSTRETGSAGALKPPEMAPFFPAANTHLRSPESLASGGPATCAV